MKAAKIFVLLAALAVIACSSPQPGDTFKDCRACPTMVVIPAGTFVQGSPVGERESQNSERPRREVSIPAFAIGETEVTFAEWDACVAARGCEHEPDDEGWGRDERPVINVSWHDAQQYTAWLSETTGHSYRLPSESEWEYATRAGTTDRFNTGSCITTDQANFNGEFVMSGCLPGTYREQTLPVGSFSPNSFGLYDTHGNVWEWVQDCENVSYESFFNGVPQDGSAWMLGRCSHAVVRGGAWSVPSRAVRSAHRGWVHRADRLRHVGLRIAREME